MYIYIYMFADYYNKKLIQINRKKNSNIFKEQDMQMLKPHMTYNKYILRFQRKIYNSNMIERKYE